MWRRLLLPCRRWRRLLPWLRRRVPLLLRRWPRALRLWQRGRRPLLRLRHVMWLWRRLVLIRPHVLLRQCWRWSVALHLWRRWLMRLIRLRRRARLSVGRRSLHLGRRRRLSVLVKVGLPRLRVLRHGRRGVLTRRHVRLVVVVRRRRLWL